MKTPQPVTFYVIKTTHPAQEAPIYCESNLAACITLASIVLTLHDTFNAPVAKPRLRKVLDALRTHHETAIEELTNLIRSMQRSCRITVEKMSMVTYFTPSAGQEIREWTEPLNRLEALCA